MPDVNWAVLGIAAAGGLLPDAIRFAKNRQEDFPEWFRRPGYWCGLAILVVLGGLAAWLGGAKDWQSAIAMGYGGPEVISRLVGSETVTTLGRGREAFPLRRWWAN